jgi:hypothetical protein
MSTGIDAALDPFWRVLAYSFLLNAARDLGKFTSEDLRVLARSRGFSQPDDPRAWGPVLQWAKRESLVRPVGTKLANLPESKRRVMTVWEWTGWA